ncbi:hypothetical protein B0A52_05049 [Exophiala mesophila]|uniref:Xylanolytic transcriptional activator regulatory domain-containing protein n=1 Tax=Exophiala mesophila TaxID=212818 RepID=A0A438N760_EXOME|nr:hypothetical protein B0A52_05049 [Exophiala mesophila]
MKSKHQNTSLQTPKQRSRRKSCLRCVFVDGMGEQATGNDGLDAESIEDSLYPSPSATDPKAPGSTSDPKELDTIVINNPQTLVDGGLRLPSPGSSGGDMMHIDPPVTQELGLEAVKDISWQTPTDQEQGDVFSNPANVTPWSWFNWDDDLHLDTTRLELPLCDINGDAGVNHSDLLAMGRNGQQQTQASDLWQNHGDDLFGTVSRTLKSFDGPEHKILLLDLPTTSDADLIRFWGQYFEMFHESFPVLHRPSAKIEECHPLLLCVVTAIGASYGSEESDKRYYLGTSMITTARNVGLFEPQDEQTDYRTSSMLDIQEDLNTVDCSLSPEELLDQDLDGALLHRNWLEWVATEQRKRLGWAVVAIHSLYHLRSQSSFGLGFDELDLYLPCDTLQGAIRTISRDSSSAVDLPTLAILAVGSLVEIADRNKQEQPTEIQTYLKSLARRKMGWHLLVDKVLDVVRGRG